MNNNGFYSSQPIANQLYPYPAQTYQQPTPSMYQQELGRQLAPPTQAPSGGAMLPIEQSYIENIVRMNKGKNVKVYMTFEQKPEVFQGIVEEAGRDHILISNPETGEWYLLLMVYVDYLTFDEKINYSYPVGSSNMLTNSPPR